MTWSKVVKSYASHCMSQYLYMRYIAYGLLVSVCLAVAVLGYRSYSRHGDEQAHKALAQAIELYERAEREDTQNLWDDAQRAFAQGYKEFSGSSLGAYFLAFQAEIAQNQGNIDQARGLLNDALANLSKTSPLYNAYALKLALIKNDKQGAEELAALAGNPKNADRDMALYYQGLIEFDSGNRPEAEKVWNNLIENFGSDSVWAQAAKAKLEYAA